MARRRRKKAPSNKKSWKRILFQILFQLVIIALGALVTKLVEHGYDSLVAAFF